jgi:hypothetical protein
MEDLMVEKEVICSGFVKALFLGVFWLLGFLFPFARRVYHVLFLTLLQLTLYFLLK